VTVIAPTPDAVVEVITALVVGALAVVRVLLPTTFDG
jgi:hypothetical protein